MTDPIADMLTRIRNAQAVRKNTIVLPYSKLKHNLATIFQEEGYIKDVAKTILADKPILSLTLKYSANGEPAIHALQRISKPGRRIYAGKQFLPYVLNNYGIAVVSTSQGLMTNKKARKQNLGGEVICEIY